MLTIRPARWPDDIALVDGLDTSFTTDQIYRVIRDEFSFKLVEEGVDPPLRKEHGAITSHEDGITTMEYAAVAEHDGVVAGFAAATYEAWNRRVAVRHLYVATGRRKSGVGMALINDLEAFARSAGARCLWLDTPNVNYPAIQFYRHSGFRLCGLDESLYDPTGPARGEIALFFVRELA
jgi:GNAT superfamily N-acetyltransferase